MGVFEDGLEGGKLKDCEVEIELEKQTCFEQLDPLKSVRWEYGFMLLDISRS